MKEPGCGCCSRLARLALRTSRHRIYSSPLPRFSDPCSDGLSKTMLASTSCDEISHSLRLHMADPQLAEKMAPRGLTPLEGTLAGQAFRTQRRVVLDHSGLAGLPLASVNRGMELGVRSLYLAPNSFSKRAVGSAEGGSPREPPLLPARCRAAGKGGRHGCACVGARPDTGRAAAPKRPLLAMLKPPSAVGLNSCGHEHPLAAGLYHCDRLGTLGALAIRFLRLHLKSLGRTRYWALISARPGWASAFWIVISAFSQSTTR